MQLFRELYGKTEFYNDYLEICKNGVIRFKKQPQKKKSKKSNLQIPKEYIKSKGTN